MTNGFSRRPVRVGSIVAVLTTAWLAAAPAWADPNPSKCRLEQVAQLDVDVTAHRALLPVEIDGRKAWMIIDTGASSSLLFRGALNSLGLHEYSIFGGFRMSGVGGETAPGMVALRTFKLGQATAPDLHMMVAGEQQTGLPAKDGWEAVGLLGEDVLSHWDLELDLAHKAVRLLHSVGCRGDQVVYWRKAYSQAKLEADSSLFGHAAIRALLNGKAVDAYLDTGSPVSVVTLAAAARAGVTPNSPGVERTGSASGIGAYVSPAWTATFDTLTVGDETIRNAKIKMSDMFSHATYMELGSLLSRQESDLPSMLLGFDFCRAHRVMIANSQRMIYFSYNGGPVFDTAAAPANDAAALSRAPATAHREPAPGTP